ncbi:MAG: hypothetical protein Q4G22_14835 [Paracoccus sp. (in: a-proteobacteria)]|uniref:hypothetical protein n=1 Tax=Paracoccus sp. TaxID=267 RepID=UPI0026DFCD5F|nr:hypothetical protein [Paracoccus sp. (in: a-proteobacteria)]MDO5633088.1 hypothetical protein [Paracoccus sp. (in: a-proteobacteria)]
MARLTIKKIAEIMVKVYNLDPDSLPFVQGRLKNFNAKLGILRAEESNDHHRTRTLDEIGAAEAVLFSELADMGFDAQILREVREHLDRNPIGMELICNPEAFRSMEKPRFEMRLYRDNSPVTMRHYSIVTFDEPKSRASKTLDNRDIYEKQLASVLTIDLGILLDAFLFEFGQVVIYGDRRESGE